MFGHRFGAAWFACHQIRRLAAIRLDVIQLPRPFSIGDQLPVANADGAVVQVMEEDKIALYRGQTVVKKAVPASRAVDELIELIREDGNWLEPMLQEAVDR